MRSAFQLFQATPKLSEDKVKQCVDARLGECPAKAVANVINNLKIFLAFSKNYAIWQNSVTERVGYLYSTYMTIFFCCAKLEQMAAVAALCVQYEADFRPNMSIIVKALQPLLNTRSGPPGGAPRM